MKKQGLLVVFACILLIACSNQNVKSSVSKGEKEKYVDDIMSSLLIATDTLYDAYYMKSQHYKGSLEEIEDNLAPIEEAMEKYKNIGPPPVSDLNHLYNLVGKSINTVNDFIKYAPNAIFNNDPQFDEKY